MQAEMFSSVFEVFRVINHLNYRFSQDCDGHQLKKRLEEVCLVFKWAEWIWGVYYHVV